MSDLMLKIEEAEQAVVGAMLIDGRCVGDVLAVVRAEDFVTPRYRRLFIAARDLFGQNVPLDAVTILDAAGPELKDMVYQCMDHTPTAANVLHYCSILRENAALLGVRQMAQKLSEAEDLSEARDLMAAASNILTARLGVTVTSLAGMMASFMQRIGQPKPEYVHWGLGMLDGALYTGPGSYVLIGARPSTGKTALALQLGLNIAKTKRVGFFSLETSVEVAGDRLAAANLSISLPSIKNRKADPSVMAGLAYQLAHSDVFTRPFDFIAASSMSVAEIRSLALANRYDVIIIDYVQLIRPATRGDRTEQMQAVSMELRALTQLTGIVVVALAQLRRPDTQGKAKAPTMADLKESGQFEQDADAVLLMYHENPDDRSSDRWIKVEKNKEGYAGLRARFRFDGENQRFEYVDKDGKALKPKFEEIDDGQEEIPEVWKSATGRPKP